MVLVWQLNEIDGRILLVMFLQIYLKLLSAAINMSVSSSCGL